jgi:hypothetical protein
MADGRQLNNWDDRSSFLLLAILPGPRSRDVASRNELEPNLSARHTLMFKHFFTHIKATGRITPINGAMCTSTSAFSSYLCHDRLS